MSSYKFRILIDTEDQEEIFRDILLPGNSDFEQFYQAIIEAYEFRGDQLASFYVSNESWDKGHEIALMDMGVGRTLDSPSIMKETLIEDMITESNQKLILVYDFMKMWCFLVELVETSELEVDRPSVELTMGKAPSEDSKEIDLESDMAMPPPANLGDDIDDIFSEFQEGEEEEDEFENLDDIDI